MSKILIVEDDKILNNMYRVKFTNAGFTIQMADNGEEALEQMKSFQPDLVLLDLMMPVMDGFKTLEHVQNDDALKKIPIIVLTNLSMGEDTQKALKLGAKDYIVKSDLTPNQILDKIKPYLKN